MVATGVSARPGRAGDGPPDLYEVASLQRASAWMQFTHITLPYLRFPLLLALLFRTIDTLKLFDLVYIMTGAAPEIQPSTSRC